MKNESYMNKLSQMNELIKTKMDMDKTTNEIGKYTIQLLDFLNY